MFPHEGPPLLLQLQAGGPQQVDERTQRAGMTWATSARVCGFIVTLQRTPSRHIRHSHFVLEYIRCQETQWFTNPVRVVV